LYKVYLGKVLYGTICLEKRQLTPLAVEQRCWQGISSLEISGVAPSWPDRRLSGKPRDRYLD